MKIISVTTLGLLVALLVPQQSIADRDEKRYDVRDDDREEKRYDVREEVRNDAGDRDEKRYDVRDAEREEDRR